MPHKAISPCRIPSCKAYATNEGYCQRHAHRHEIRAKLDEKKKPSIRKRGYDKNHFKLRTIMLHEQPLCAVCGQPATDLDHIDGDPFNRERKNLQMLCKACHSLKTNREQGGGWSKVNERRKAE